MLNYLVVDDAISIQWMRESEAEERVVIRSAEKNDLQLESCLWTDKREGLSASPLSFLTMMMVNKCPEEVARECRGIRRDR